MAHLISIVGKPGAGKTYSLRNLPEEETYIINSDNKPLTFKGSKKRFNSENRNYVQLNDPKLDEFFAKSSEKKDMTSLEKVIYLLSNIKKRNPKIKYIVIDTVSALTYDIEMRIQDTKTGNLTQSGWYDLSKYMYQLVATLPADLSGDDIFIFMLFHETDDGQTRRIQVNGRKTDKFIEGYFNNVLFLEKEGTGLDAKYLYRVMSDGVAQAKTLGEMFDTEVIEADAMKVVEAIKSWE